MKIQLSHTFKDIIGVENFLEAWEEFIRGKRDKHDIQEFSLQLMDNILGLNRELLYHTYRHGSYQAFSIHDPKPRRIHKAVVRDRLLHHAVCRILYPFFNKKFMADSFSGRVGKGIHKALNKFRRLTYQIGKNNTKTCWVLKCDIKKFFANIDQEILLDIIQKHISDTDVLWLLERIIKSFYNTVFGKGLPLGNFTSQLFVNIYLNEFDQFVKHKLRAKYYIRYADDFIILSEDGDWLRKQIIPIKEFLRMHLRLELHPEKIFIKTLASGVDFLGWIHFSDHRVLREATKRRMFKRLRENRTQEVLSSYLGLLSHGNAYKLKRLLSACYEE